MSFFDAVYDAGGVVEAGAGWIHPSRTVDFDEIIYVIKGTVKIFEEDRRYELHKGDCIVLEKGKYHGGYERADKDVQFYWIQFFSDYEGFSQMKHVSFGSSSTLTVLSEQLMHAKSKPTYPREAIDCYVRLMLSEINVASFKNTNTSYPVCGTVAEWISKNCSRKIEVEEISANFGYNKDYISRVFKKNFGLSLKEYIDSERMKYIKGVLLTTEYPLKQVSRMCGFSDYKSFLKFFSYHNEETPHDFRKKYFSMSK